MKFVTESKLVRPTLIPSRQILFAKIEFQVKNKSAEVWFTILIYLIVTIVKVNIDDVN